MWLQRHSLEGNCCVFDIARLFTPDKLFSGVEFGQLVVQAYAMF